MKRSFSKNRNKWLVGFLSILALTLLLSLGKRGFIAQIRARQEKKRLIQSIEALEEKRKTLQQEKVKLDDPEYIERIAREEYGMAKKNEKVYRVVPKEE